MPAEMTTQPVLSVLEHGESLKSFYFQQRFAVEPGQFVLLWLPGVDEKPFSVSDIADGRMEITVKAVGPMTRAMMAVSPGQRIGIRGPFGRGFSPVGPALVIGGGCGAAPVRYLARRLQRDHVACNVVLGARTAADIPFRDEYAGSATLVTEDGSIGHAGRVTDVLPDMLAQGGYRRACAAGPEGMLLAVRALCEARGLDYELSFERYMKCGVGICGHCAMDGSGLRMCVEGPVLGPRDLLGATDLGRAHRDATGARPASATGADQLCGVDGPKG